MDKRRAEGLELVIKRHRAEGFRAGAEAMREAAAREASGHIIVSLGTADLVVVDRGTARRIYDAIRSLSIPEDRT